MHPNKFIELVARNETFIAPLKSHLQQVITSEPFLRAARTVLVEAQAHQMSVAKTLPKPDVVIEMAYKQGLAEGLYRAFEALANLTEIEEEKKDGTGKSS